MDVMGPSAFLVLLIFIVGYLFIIFEHTVHINKATSALMSAVLMWLTVFVASEISYHVHLDFLEDQLSDITQVVLFLIGALSIVEIISVHKGFNFITRFLQFEEKRGLLWVIALMTFFLSAVLDNLTTTIVMVSILRKVVPKTVDRWLIGSGVVIAANAGGAWTPIGDVTTTMLWIAGKLSTDTIVFSLFLPSLICAVVSLFVLSFSLRGKVEGGARELDGSIEPHGLFVLILGVALLIFVPIFKMSTGLPPFMGMLFGLSVLWIYTDIVHYRYPARKHLRVVSVLSLIDLSSVIFFLGILLAVGALEEVGFLEIFAKALQEVVGNPTWIAALIGMFSAVVDNVPLVAASLGMYKASTYPPDSPFWQMVAYCAGTGGSLLVIGSAAGVVFMGMEKIDFFWYVKRVTLAATLGYFAGLGAYLIQHALVASF